VRHSRDVSLCVRLAHHTRTDIPHVLFGNSGKTRHIEGTGSTACSRAGWFLESWFFATHRQDLTITLAVLGPVALHQARVSELEILCAASRGEGLPVDGVACRRRRVPVRLRLVKPGWQKGAGRVRRLCTVMLRLTTDRFGPRPPSRTARRPRARAPSRARAASSGIERTVV